MNLQEISIMNIEKVYEIEKLESKSYITIITTDDEAIKRIKICEQRTKKLKRIKTL